MTTQETTEPVVPEQTPPKEENAPLEPDWKTEAQKERERAEKAEQRAKSIEGQVRTQKERDARQRGIERDLRLLIDSRAKDDPEFAERQSELSAQDEAARFRGRTQKMLTSMASRLERLNLKVSDDPAVAEATATWNELANSKGGTLVDYEDIYDSVIDRLDTIKDERHAAERAEKDKTLAAKDAEIKAEKQRVARLAGVNDLTTPPPGGAVESDQGWLDRYADEAGGNIPGTPENAKRFRDITAKGLKPRVRTR